MIRWLVPLAIGVLGASSAITTPPTRGQLELELPRLLEANQDSAALLLLESYLAAIPDDAQVLFDCARIASRLGDARGSAGYVIRALRAGFADRQALDAHPDLARLRSHEAWEQVRAMVQQFDEIARVATASKEHPANHTAPAGVADEGIATRSLHQWLERFGGGRYRVEAFPALHLVTASAVEPEGFRRTMLTIEKLSAALTRHLFGGIQEDLVLLVVATRKDGATFLVDENIGGLYDHEDRRLVARETGGSLRHEYTHVVHYGQMQRLHQHHPMWIQEGLATLFEDWKLADDGALVILPNLRTNDAFDRVRRHQALPWVDFFALDGGSFMSQPRWNYAQARSILMFLSAHGKLTGWYRAFVAGWGDDPTGRRALEQVFGAPLARIEESWKEWVVAKGRQDSTIDAGDGVMGATFSNATDGVRIDNVTMGSPAQRAGIRSGDIITDIDSTEIRSIGDYLLAMADRRAGENVKVRLRRGKTYSIFEVTLAPGNAVPQ